MPPIHTSSSDRTAWSRPFLRWAGSKRRLVPLLLASLPDRFSRYVEPFAGSACLFFALRPKLAVLGDINNQLMHTYETVSQHPRIVARALSEIPSTKSAYYRVRDRFSDDLPALQRAVYFVYLNRHCFNGVYRTNRKGKFNVPLGSRTGAIPSESEFYRCSVALRAVTFRACDFEDCLSATEKGDFVYLDPPYSSSSRPRYGEYGYDSFQPPDINRLKSQLTYLNRIGCKFLLSYTDSDDTRRAFSRWSLRRITVRRNVAGFSSHRRTAGEILVANYPIPEGE